MTFRIYRPITLGAAFLVAGCSFASESLWPSLTGEDPTGKPAQAAKARPAPAARTAQRPAITAQRPPALGTTNFKAPGVTPGRNTGTYVGQQVAKLRGELRRLQSNVSQNNKKLQSLRVKTVQDSQRYHRAVSAINARLQVGTTPGNPILVEQFNQALSNLDKITEDISQMNGLTTGVTGDSTLAAFLSENTRAAFRLSGAVDADHTQLAILEDEVNRTVVLIDRLLKELGEDIQRQTLYISTERSNLNTLSASIKSGEILGTSLANRAVGAIPGVASRGSFGSRSMVGRRPLVVIRFDRKDVAYEQALYNAVSRALERRPNATFELVAVAPALGGQARVALNSTKARRNAENVMRSLRGMGLPPRRTAISARVSRSARTNEVHLFLN
jgi:hypothetical protein